MIFTRGFFCEFIGFKIIKTMCFIVFSVTQGLFCLWFFTTALVFTGSENFKPQIR
jgi:hypothetical protein